MCNCLTWCRDFHEMEGLPKFIPISNHHPRCEHYKLINLKRVSFDGSSFIDYPEQVSTYLELDENPESYEVSDIRLTQDQFDRLPEFDGF